MLIVVPNVCLLKIRLFSTCINLGKSIDKMWQHGCKWMNEWMNEWMNSFQHEWQLIRSVSTEITVVGHLAVKGTCNETEL